MYRQVYAVIHIMNTAQAEKSALFQALGCSPSRAPTKLSGSSASRLHCMDSSAHVAALRSGGYEGPCSSISEVGLDTQHDVRRDKAEKWSRMGGRVQPLRASHIPLKSVVPPSAPEIVCDEKVPTVNRIDSGWEPSRISGMHGTSSGAQSSWIEGSKSFHTTRKFRKRVDYGDKGLPKTLCGGPQAPLNRAFVKVYDHRNQYTPLSRPYFPPSPPDINTDGAVNSPSATSTHLEAYDEKVYLENKRWGEHGEHPRTTTVKKNSEVLLPPPSPFPPPNLMQLAKKSGLIAKKPSDVPDAECPPPPLPSHREACRQGALGRRAGEPPRHWGTAHIPGYEGHIPSTNNNAHAVLHGRCEFDRGHHRTRVEHNKGMGYENYARTMPGYGGHQLKDSCYVAERDGAPEGDYIRISAPPGSSYGMMQHESTRLGTRSAYPWTKSDAGSMGACVQGFFRTSNDPHHLVKGHMDSEFGIHAAEKYNSVVRQYDGCMHVTREGRRLPDGRKFVAKQVTSPIDSGYNCGPMLSRYNPTYQPKNAAFGGPLKL